MSERIRVAVDAMGGDNAPQAIVEGSLQAVAEKDDIDVIFVGKQDQIEKALSGYSYDKSRVSILHASEVIETDESPVAAIRSKKDSSIAVGMRLVRDGEADAFASAGNSGALLVGGQLIIGRMRGIARPPFAAVIPTEKGASLLLDCGANVDARPEHLVTFARLGSIYMENVMGINNPTVGIVNIGAEEEKGNALVKETFPLMREDKSINFIGSVEARDIPQGGCDVLVCEAFAGNIVLKMYEGTATVLLRAIKKGLMSSLRSKIGALLIKPALKDMMATFDAGAYGGAPMLGLKGLLVKMHGNTKAREVKIAVLKCADFTRMKINDKILKYTKEL